jgi:arylsulfatase A-like enzyme
MNRTAAALVGTLALLAAGPAPQAAGRPNFLLIVADDLGWADVGFHNPKAKTPNLDRLAREGVELDQHYVATMCSPTRAALLSGRNWSRFGITSATNNRVFPFDTVTLASALRSVGYETAITGKWHLGSKPEWGPRRFGFDRSYGSLAGGVGPYDHRYKKGPYTETWHRDDRLLQEEGHVTDLITREAVAWIEKPRQKPFFLYLPFTAVHIPIDEPKKYLDLHADVEPPSRRQYAACVSHLDDAIGQVVAALERAGKLRDTLLVFTSDNGGTPNARNDDPQYPGTYASGPAGGSNLPLRGNKTEVYEGGIRVTALAHWPGRLKPAKLTAPIHAVDWMPTLTKLAGYAPERDLKWDGRDVWPLLAGEPAGADRVLYWAGAGGRASALRRGAWKLIVHKGPPAREELYNLAEDPFEKSDLAAAHPERVSELRKLLAAEAARDNDAVAKD